MAWYDGNDPSTAGPTIVPILPADAVAPTQWDDKSGNARHLNNRNSTPLYKTPQAGRNGVMRFDGVDDYFYMTSPFMYANGTIEIWAVYRSNESGLGTIIAEGLTTNAAAHYSLLDVDSTDDVQFTLSNTAGVDRIVNAQDRSTNAFDLIIATDLGAAGGSNVEVVDIDAGTTAAYTRDAMTMTRTAVGYLPRSTPAVFLDGDVAEIVVLASQATSSERALLTNYFNTKFGRWWTPT